MRRRIIAFIMVLVMLVMNTGIIASAEAVLTLPQALRVIEEEAFYGTNSIDTIVLSDQVKEIHARAFLNSTLSHIYLPESIEFIAEDAFDGPDKVDITASKGSYAYEWALNHGYISEKVDAMAFEIMPKKIVIQTGTTYQLSTSTLPINATAVAVTWSSSQSDVASVNGKGMITAQNVGTANITAITDNGLTDLCEVTVVNSVASPEILSVEQNGMGTVTVNWNSLGAGYEYNVYETDGDSLTLLCSTAETSYTTFVTSMGNHSYCVQACIHNGEGLVAESEVSEAYTVNVQVIWNYGTAITRVEQTGDRTISISWRGVAPVSYYEIAEIIGDEYQIQESNLTGESAYIQSLATGNHRFAIRSVYSNSSGTFCSDWSAAKSIEVFSEDVWAPVAPQLIFTDPTKAFSDSENTTPVYAQEDIEVQWIPNVKAHSYAVTLDRKTETGYETIISETDIADSLYLISASHFAGISEQTIYRFGISSQASAIGEPAYSYFLVSAPDKQISISSNRWERSSRFAGIREFTVTSELPWTAEANAEWIHISRLENTLAVSLPENATRQVRTGQITISNGENTEQITVIQDTSDEPPLLGIYGQTLSIDPNQPTEIPKGGFLLSINNDSNYTHLKLYQKANGTYPAEWKRWATTGNSTLQLPYVWGSITFSAGKEFCIEASGHYSKDKNQYEQFEIGDDSNCQKYYIRMVDDGHYALLDGQPSLEQIVMTETTVQLMTSNDWTAESDSDWLTFTHSAESDVRKQKLFVTAAANYTGAERTGHITVSCGPTNAVLTIRQPDLTPRVITPANLSKNANSPTTVGAGMFTFSALGTGMTWEYKSGSSWVDASEGETFSWDLGINEDYILQEIFTTGKTYRMTISDDSGHSTAYYLKRSTNSDKEISIKTEHTAYYPIIRLNKPAGASTEAVLLKASDSWTVASDSSWLSVSPASGSSGSNKSVTVSLAANTTASERTGTLSFKIDSGVYATLLIVQAANGTDFVAATINNIPVDHSKALEHVSGIGDSLGIYAFSSAPSDEYNARINAQSDADWLSVKAEIQSGKTAGVSVTDNTTGSRRTGTITFNYGSATKTVTITQEPKLDVPVIISPAIIGTASSPAVLSYDDNPLTVSWNHVGSAARYDLLLKYYDSEGTETYSLHTNDIGSSTCSAVLPSEWFDAAYTGRYRLRIAAVDSYGNEGTANFAYFTRQTGSAVFINGKTNEKWENVTDAGAASNFTIVSGTTWTASSGSSWIVLDNASGNSGEELSVRVNNNQGAARTGTVTVQSGSSTAVLTIKQCAVLTPYPVIKTPALSGDVSNPTIFSKSNSLTVTWDIEPQTDYYSIRLGRVINAHTTAGIRGAHVLRNIGTYTFDTSDLTEGQTYSIILMRNAEDENGNDRSMGTEYFFTYAPSNAFLKIDGTDSTELHEADKVFETDGEEGHIYYNIEASGTWSATVSDPSWIMVARNVRTRNYLDEEEMEPEDYQQYVGNNGASFCISVLENNTGYTRTGTVTISTAGVTIPITVIQGQYYVLPEITAPSLGVKPKYSTEIPLNDMSLQWTAGEGSTGWYNLYLYEKEGLSYNKVYSISNIRTKKATIPVSELRENTYYRLLLETEIENSGDYDGRYYYFHTGSESALSVIASVNWMAANNGGYVDISASAYGGAGGYYYAYQLLLDGMVEQETTWENLRYYQFKPWSNGHYQVKVIVKDAANQQATYSSENNVENTSTISVSTPNHYNVSLDSGYQFLDYSMLAPRSWSVTACPDWITPSVSGISFDDDIRFVVSRNDGVSRIGKIEIRSSTGIVSDLTITQNGSKSVALAVIEETVAADNVQTNISFTASDKWTASSNSAWATVQNRGGNSGNQLLIVALAENPETALRTAVISINCNGETACYTIHQMGRTAEQTQLILSTLNWQLSSPSAETLTVSIDTQNEWRIDSIPLWITSTKYSGTGNDEISLYCSGNEEMASRSDAITIVSGGKSRSIYVTQPGKDSLASVVMVDVSQNTAETGEIITFTIRTKNADQVQLIVDGVGYEQISVTDNQAVIDRAFARRGEREISFMPYWNGQSGIVSETIELNITSIDDLADIHFISGSNCYVGQSKMIEWEDVPNATLYTVCFSDGNTYRKLEETEEPRYELDGSYLSEAGEYSIEVIATANNFSQSTSALSLNAEIPTRNFSVSLTDAEVGFELNDEIIFNISNPSQYPVKLRIRKQDSDELPVFYPQSEAFTDTAGVIKFIPENDATYIADLVAYSSIPVINNGTYWGVSTSNVTFTVTGGVLENSCVGNGNLSQSIDQTEYISADTTHTITKLEVYLDDGQTPILTIMADDPTQCYFTQSNTRLHFRGKVAKASEGYHTYRFVATNIKGETRTKEESVFVYTPYDTSLTRYPADKQVYILEKPQGTAMASPESLKLSDQIKVLGSYGTDMYYVSVNTISGYVRKNRLVETEQIDWSEYQLKVLSWANPSPAVAYGEENYLADETDYSIPMNETNKYSIEFEWMVEPNVPSRATFHVYLEPSEENNPDMWRKIDVSDDLIVKKTSLRFPTSTLRMGYFGSDSCCCDYWIRVDMIDSVTGEVVQSAKSKGYRRIGSRAHTKWRFDHLETQMENVINAHYATMDVMELKEMSSVYSIITGKWDSLNLTDIQIGALVAEQIMDKIAATKVKSALDIKDIKNILALGEFDANFIKMYEDKAVQFAEKTFKSSKETSWVFQLDRSIDDDRLEELNKACFEQARTQEWLDCFNGITKIMEAVDAFTRLLEDFYSFRSVTRNDVEVYITEFEKSNNSSLQFAATCLKSMTEGSTIEAREKNLLMYLGLKYGLSAIASMTGEAAYEAIKKALPPSWQLAIDGAAIANDILFNTSETVEIALDYAAVYTTLQSSVGELRDALKNLKTDPIKYYSDFENKKEVFLITLRIELGYMDSLCKAINESGIQQFWILLDKRNEIKFDGEKYYNSFASYLNDALYSFYTTAVQPFR